MQNMKENNLNQKEYFFDKEQFKKLTVKWCRKKKAWIWLNLLAAIFALIGIGAMAFMLYQAMDPVVPSLDARILIMVGGLVLAVLPFIFCYVTRTQAIRVLGKPFSVMRRMFLISNDSGFMFGYHDNFDRKYLNSAIVHQIAYSNIHHVEIDRAQQLFTVVGTTERVEYQNISTLRERYSFTSGQFGDMASFSFFTCFENAEDFYRRLSDNGVYIEYVG